MNFLVCEIQYTLNKTVVWQFSSLNQVYREVLSDHVCTELIKLNGIDFKSHRLTIEEALAKPKVKEPPPSGNKTTEIKNHQAPIEEVPVVPVEKSYSKATRSHNSVFNNIIFTDSIPKAIQMHKFNRLIKNRQAKMFSFHGASSHQLLHYLDVHLRDQSIDTVIIHIGINDLLTNSSRSVMIILSATSRKLQKNV